MGVFWVRVAMYTMPWVPHVVAAKTPQFALLVDCYVYLPPVDEFDQAKRVRSCPLFHDDDH